jgi:glutathione S-transferase
MQIHWFKAQAPLRVLALAKHLGIEAETIEVDMMGGNLRTPAYLALNPNAKAPTLVDGDTVVWESAAIMAHLCVKAGSDMWPSANAAEQVELLRWLTWGDAHWSPAVAPYYFEHIVKPTFAIGPPDPVAYADAAPTLARHAAVLDAHLRAHEFVALDRLTIADFCLASMARYWRETHAPLAQHVNVVRWLDGLMALPAWANPWPPSQYARM